MLVKQLLLNMTHIMIFIISAGLYLSGWPTAEYSNAVKKKNIIIQCRKVEQSKYFVFNLYITGNNKFELFFN
ncbi:MAG: hypothetical protein CMJ06_04015 [Pelagibacterales bacterium]|nr:hypothetical protein [Pelagibacterales bacterium]